MWFNLKFILFCGSAFAFSIFLTICIFLIATSSVYPIITRSKKEKYYYSASLKKHLVFPSITDPPNLSLSVIIPAYNEEKRLPPMLDECLEFLEKRSNKDFSYEIIIVSDGSTDGTVKVGGSYEMKYGSEKVRVLELEKNRGKGGAVKLGMQSARGAMLLFADADGATKFSDLVKLEQSITELLNLNIYDIEVNSSINAISIGSRAHLEDEAVATRNFFRTILMYGFHFLVKIFAVRGIRDTQCGFKLFTRKAAEMCFESLHVERWAFDVEMLYIAQKLKIPLTEVAVNWTEIEGSKIIPVWSWLQMGSDLILIWLRYTIGAWKIASQRK